MKYLLILCLTACTAPAAPFMDARAPLATTCTPDDGLDDRACVQAEIDALCLAGGGTLRFASGTYEFSKDPTLGTRYTGSIRVECPGIRLTGEGFSSILMMSGDGGLATWNLVKVTADPTTNAPTTDFELDHVTLATDLAFNTEEQTHTLAFSGFFGPVSGGFVHHVKFRNIVRPDRAGDCIRLVGEPTGLVSGINLGNLLLEECDRSGVGVQRSVEGLTIHDSTFAGIGKTPIDLEPTGTGAIVHMSVTGNTFLSGVSLAGQGDITQPSTDIVFAGNTVGGRVGIFNVRRLSLTGNTVEYLALDGEGAIGIKASEGVVVVANTARRLAGSIAGAVVKINGSNGKFPTRVMVSGNILTNEVAGDVVDVESAQDLTVGGNDITGSGSTSAGFSARATGRDLDRLQVVGNRFFGSLQYAIRVQGNPFFVRAAQIVANMSSGPTVGLRCENPLKITGPIVHASYLYQGATAAQSGCTAVTQAP